MEEKNKKTVLSFRLNEYSKMLLNKLSGDKKITKSALLEQLIYDYFDDKKDALVFERIENKIEKLEKKLRENDEIIDDKIDAILERVSNFDAEKILKKFIETMKDL